VNKKGSSNAAYVTCCSTEMAADYGFNVLFCIPNRTKNILLVSVLLWGLGSQEAEWCRQTAEEFQRLARAAGRSWTIRVSVHYQTFATSSNVCSPHAHGPPPGHRPPVITILSLTDKSARHPAASPQECFSALPQAVHVERATETNRTPFVLFEMRNRKKRTLFGAHK
jgi:hypothetical protein